jgi:hypothetical protein
MKQCVAAGKGSWRSFVLADVVGETAPQPRWFTGLG